MIKPEPRVKRRQARTSTRRSAKAKSSAKPDNGLVGAILRTDDVDTVPERTSTRSRVATRARSVRTAAPSPVPLTRRDPEATARQYLERALEGSAATSRSVAATGLGKADFKSLGAEAVPLTGTTMVKFRQTFNKIPVYGSLVTVEIDRKNQCLGINSSLGTPAGVRHIASISPEKALAVAAKAAG